MALPSRAVQLVSGSGATPGRTNVLQVQNVGGVNRNVGGVTRNVGGVTMTVGGANRPGGGVTMSVGGVTRTIGGLNRNVGSVTNTAVKAAGMAGKLLSSPAICLDLQTSLLI